MTDPRGEANRQFEYLLNAMEAATQAECPADAGYAAKRKAVFEYVAKLESLRSATAPLPANARAVAEKCLDILCASLHEAEAEGHDLPACVSLAWSEVTMIQTTTLPDAPQPATRES